MSHPFAAPAPGQQRWVIELPPCSLVEAGERLVQLRAGAPGPPRGLVVVDWVQGVVDGWGYPYWTLRAAGPLLTPRAGERAASLAWSAPHALSYNPRLPLVVYGERHWQLEWRVLVASGDFIAAGY